MPRMINAAGMAVIKEAEGFNANAYVDSGGVPTIGYGHTAGVKMGDVCTPEQANDMLLSDLSGAEAAVSDLVKVTLTDNQFSALVLFVFNVGAGAFGKSTLLRDLNAHDYDSVPAQLRLWVFANGKRIKGLENRRAKEINLWSMK